MDVMDLRHSTTLLLVSFSLGIIAMAVVEDVAILLPVVSWMISHHKSEKLISEKKT